MLNYSKIEKVEQQKFQVVIFKLHRMIRTQQKLTPEDITILNETFEVVSSRAKDAATFFYNRLIEMDDDFEPLLNNNFKEFTQSYITVVEKCLKFALENSDSIDELKSTIKSQNFASDKFDTIGNVFIDSLRHAIGDEFNDKILYNWVKVYKKAVAEVA